MVLHLPYFDKSIGRLNAAELNVFVGPDYVITLPNLHAEAGRAAVLPAVEQRASCARSTSRRAPATCSTRSCPSRSTTASRSSTRSGSSSTACRTRSGTSAARTSPATSPTPSRRSSPTARSSSLSAATLRLLERARTRYLPEDLEVYFDDIVDSAERIWDQLDNYKEVVEALEQTNETVIAAQPERHPAAAHRVQRDPAAADADRRHLRHELDRIPFQPRRTTASMIIGRHAADSRSRCSGFFRRKRWIYDASGCGRPGGWSTWPAPAMPAAASSATSRRLATTTALIVHRGDDASCC